MEEPKLSDYGLSGQDLVRYESQCHQYYEKERMAIEQKKKSIKKIMMVLTIGSILLGIILAIANSESDVWFAYLISPFGFMIIPLLILFQNIDSVHLSEDKLKELRAVIDSELKAKCEKYYREKREYENYIEKCQRDFWITMDGYRFEKAVASLFRTNGYNATVTPVVADGGVDIILEKKGERIAVQCKHHAKPIGPNDVRALQGVVASQNYSKGIFVSLNGYTATVRQEVRSGNVQIELLELKDILQMAKGSQENSLKNPENVPRKTDFGKKPRLGDIVTHKTFGEGIIIEIVPKDNNEAYLTIDFVHSVKKFVFPNSITDDHLAFKKISEIEVFREYSFNGYWMFAREEYKKVLTIFPNDNKDYSHLINGLKEVMKIENLDFKALVINFEKIRPEYYYGGKRFEISQQKGLLGAITTFESYVTSIREQRLSIKGFYDFLIKESNDNEIYLSNKRSDGESIIETLLNKNPIDKLILEHIEIYIERIQYILSKEKIDIACLARYSACASRSEFIEKYPIYDEPSTDTILEWLTRYYKKTITTI